MHVLLLNRRNYRFFSRSRRQYHDCYLSSPLFLTHFAEQVFPYGARLDAMSMPDGRSVAGGANVAIPAPIIIITHFVNPHRLWFKYETCVRNGNAELEQLEQDLERHALKMGKLRLHLKGYQPERGEHVAIKHLTWNKWIRARVDAIDVVCGEGPKFVVWATDHGVPLETKSTWLRPLPKELAERQIVSVFQAGITNIVPAAKRLNYTNMTLQISRTDQWSADAVHTFEEILANVETIQFTRTMVLEETDDGVDNHYFGHFEFTTFAGFKIDPAVTLEQLQHAMTLPEKRFDDDIQTARTRFTPRWLGNDLVKRVNDNVADTNALRPPPGFGDTLLLPNGESAVCGVTKKVSEWQLRNQQTPIDDDAELECCDSASGDGVQSALVAQAEAEFLDEPKIMHSRPDDVGEEQFVRRCGSGKPNQISFASHKEVAAAAGIPKATGRSSAVEDVVVKAAKRAEALRRIQQSAVGPTSAVSADLRGVVLATPKAKATLPKEPPKQSAVVTSPSKANPPSDPSAVATNVARQKLQKRSQLLANLQASDKSTSGSLDQQSTTSEGSSMRASLMSGQEAPTRVVAVVPSKENATPTKVDTVPAKSLSQFRQSAKQDHCITNSLFLYRVLVHGRNRPRPLERLANANFTKEVHDALHHMRFRDMFRIQAYSWPHIARGNSLVMVNAAGSGKTMAYLPAVCSMVQEKCADERITNGEGPICVIVCVSSKKVKQVSSWCRKCVPASDEKTPPIVEGYGVRGQRKTMALLLNGCKIFVCTAPSLQRLITASTVNIFNRGRLCQLVIDDFDLIVSRFDDALKFVLKRLTHIDAAKSRQSPVQLIVTARTWSPTLGLFFKIGRNVALLMGAYAEAAVYARSNVQMELVPNEEKNEKVLHFLLNNDYHEQRTIVVCNMMEEAMQLADRCRLESLSFVMVHEKSSDREIDYAKTWNTQHDASKFEVLICTDHMLPDLAVSMAQNIVHYSIPSSWSAFSYRFSSMFDYFEDLVVNQDCIRNAPLSFILLDEHNNAQLPRLVQFMVEHGVESIAPAVQRLVKRIDKQNEQLRNRQLVAFCTELLLLGECLSTGCTMRHTFTEADRSKASIPRSGVVKLVVMEVLSPIHFSGRLVAHREAGSNDWCRMKENAEYLRFSMRLMNHYGDEDNHQTHPAAKLGDLCVIAEDNSYQRCQITELKKIRTSTIVSVYLIDSGKLITSCRDNELLHLEDEFRSFPAQAVQIRIAKCVPYDLDSEWDATIAGMVERWLDEASANASCTHIEGRIELSVMNTLWLDTLRVVEQLPYIVKPVPIMSVQSNLIEKHFAIVDDTALVKLTGMALGAGILDDMSDVASLPSSSEVEAEVVPQILSIADVSQQRGRRHRHTASSPTVSLRNGSSGQITVSSEPIAPRIATKVMEHDWAEMSFNEFHAVYVSTYYSPRLFYVQIYSECLTNLFEAIDEHALLPIATAQPLHEPTVGHPCLANYNGQLNRAKIVQISCTHLGDVEATLFFVDFGQRLSVPIAQLYVLPQHLLDIAPYQAVLCQLIGIKPHTDDKSPDWSADMCNQIFDQVLDVAENVYMRCIQRKASNSQYTDGDAFVVEAIDRGCGQDVNLNRRIVEMGLAEFDEKSEYFLQAKNDDWDIETKDFQQTSLPQQMGEMVDGSLQDVDFDIEFTDEEIMELLRLPPTTKLVDICTVKTDTTNQPATLLPSLPETNHQLKAIEAASITNYTPPPTPEPELFVAMPKLVYPHKTAAVKWQQNHSTIFVTIDTPDVCGYSLSVTNRVVDFKAKLIDNQVVSCLINLFGCVDTEYTSHEIRGLAVRVRLMKTMRGPRYAWPRLTLHDEQCRNVRFDLESFDYAKMDRVLHIGGVDVDRGTKERCESISSGDVGSEADMEFDV